MDMTEPQQRRLRNFFKLLNQYMVLLWRLGLGSIGNGNRWFGAYMVLVHRGRRSGRIYRTPVNFAMFSGDIYCTAGFGRSADWYQNIMAEPELEVWLPAERWWVRATDVTDNPNRREILKRVLIGSGLAGPVFGADPRKMGPADYDRLLATYRLVRLQRLETVSGQPGPGDLAWLWPLTGLLLLSILIGRMLNCRKV